MKQRKQNKVIKRTILGVLILLVSVWQFYFINGIPFFSYQNVEGYSKPTVIENFMYRLDSPFFGLVEATSIFILIFGGLVGLLIIFGLWGEVKKNYAIYQNKEQEGGNENE